jgi:DNA-directed RNA polymerase alpha subunit
MQVTTLETTNAALAGLLEVCARYVFGDITLWAALRGLEERMKRLDGNATRWEAGSGTPVECLGLDSHVCGVLKRAGIATAEEAADRGRCGLAKLKRMGPASLAKVEAALEKAGVRFAD